MVVNAADSHPAQAGQGDAACPHDPTPGWLLGQSQLRALPLFSVAKYIFPAASVRARMLAALQSAIVTFRRLTVAYPDDTAVLTGLGDAYLRAGALLRSTEPFTAKLDFRSAMEEYNRAWALGDALDAAPGLARVLIGLGEPAKAASLVQPFTHASAFPGPWLELLIAADETAHNFGAAETAARHLDTLGSSAYPDGVALLPELGAFEVDFLDDASLPLSFGADRLTPLSALLIPTSGAGGVVQDLSFIPPYRDDPGVTGTQPACASWTWRRDALLTGHPAKALAGWPAQSEFNSVRPSYFGCPLGDCLKLIVQTEAGQKVGNSVCRSAGYDISDGLQNLQRWAGHLRVAKTVAEQWQAATADKAVLPAFRLGEIEFLMHQYNAAAAEFGLAARRSRLVNWHDDLTVDHAELDRGAALLASGRTGEGAQLLRPLDLLGTGLRIPKFAARPPRR
jgi:hypothetical protein